MNMRDKLENVKPKEIETRSFEIITEELAASGKELPKDRELIIKRCIHTSADFEYADNVYGTYMQGVFDAPGIAEAVGSALGKKKGMDLGTLGTVDFAQYKETQYDLLAAGLREHLDIDAIYRILEEGV